MVVLLYLFKIYLKIIYFFIKFFTKQKKQVLLLSRQTNTPSINFILIEKEINRLNIENKENNKDQEKVNVLISCSKIDNEFNKILRNEVKSNIFKKIFKSFINVIKQINLFNKQMYYMASSKVVIIDGYNVLISNLKHKKNTKIIQLWHSPAAIKKFGYQTLDKDLGIKVSVAKTLNMHKNYDYFISASEKMNKYFKEAFNITDEQIKTIGLPFIDYLLDKKINKEKINEIIEKYPNLGNKINIAYVPTFRTNNNYMFDELISKFDFEKYNLIFLLHPKIEYNSSDDRVYNIKPSDVAYLDALRIVDYVITDYSGVVYDALILNKKIYLYVYDYEEYRKTNGINIDFYKEYPKYTFKEIDDIFESIDNNKYDIKELSKIREESLFILDTKNTKRLVELIKRNIDE